MKRRLVSLLLTLALFLALCPAVGTAAARGQAEAEKLYTLGLFSGTGKDSAGKPVFSLDRAPTRQEAIVMLVRLLGKETEAEAGAGSYMLPFIDVDAWALPYVGYAYQNGLTAGVSYLRLGAKDPVSAVSYITFLLRALGYSDADGDFSWQQSYLLSDELGLTHGEYAVSTGFTRGDAALLSYNALTQNLKDTPVTLIRQLVDAGAASESAAVGYHLLDTAPAGPVFRIDAYRKNGEFVGSGTGFFIEKSGVALTSLHLIAPADSATVTLTDGRRFPVSGILGASRDLDGAVIQVEGSSFPVLEPAVNSDIGEGLPVTATGFHAAATSCSEYKGTLELVILPQDSAPFYTASFASRPSDGSPVIAGSGRVIGMTVMTSRNQSGVYSIAPLAYVAASNTQTVTPLSAYRMFPEVPDFEAFSGVGSASRYTGYMGIGSAIEFRNYPTVTLNTTYPGGANVAIAKYKKLLVDKGFDKVYIAPDCSGYSTYTNTQLQIVVGLVTTNENGVNYLMVKIYDTYE